MQGTSYCMTKGSKRVNVLPTDLAKIYAFKAKGYSIDYARSSKGLPIVPETVEDVANLMKERQAQTYTDGVAPVSTVEKTAAAFSTTSVKVSEAVNKLKEMVEAGGDDLATRLKTVSEGDERMGVKGFVKAQIKKLETA